MGSDRLVRTRSASDGVVGRCAAHRAHVGSRHVSYRHVGSAATSPTRHGQSRSAPPTRRAPVQNPHASFAKGEAFAFLKAAFHKLAPPPTQAELEQMANIRPNEFKTKDGRLKSNAPMMTGCHTSWFQLGDSKQAEIAKRMFEATRSNDNRMWEDAVAEIEFVTAPPDAPLAPAPAPGAVAPGIANPAGGSASDGTDVEEESELSTEQNRVGPSRPEKRRAKERLALVSYATAMAGTEQDDPNFRAPRSLNPRHQPFCIGRRPSVALCHRLRRCSQRQGVPR